jgi:hypothetical protein
MNIEELYILLLNKNYDELGYLKFLNWRKIFQYYTELRKYHIRKIFFLMIEIGMIKRGEDYTYSLYNPNKKIKIHNPLLISFD